MNRDTLQQQLSEKIVERRLAKAKSAADSAERHGLDTYWGQFYLNEARQWELAAERAKAGDLTPYYLTDPKPSDVVFNGVSYSAKIG